MKHSKLSFFAMLIMATLGSCTDYNGPASSEYVNSVRVTVEDFKPEIPTSRTAYTVDASGFHFQWAEGDALGIYPVGGDQVKFPISKGDGSASASFDGGAWKLRSEYQYAAYYPFSAGNYTVSESALPVNYVGQKQDGNGSTTHLGAYDYLACAATTPDANGGVDLTMKHLGAFIRFQLTMPKADTFSSVVLESDGTKFVTAGSFDLTSATPSITPTVTSSTYTINLTNITTTEKNQMITVYVMVAPANLSSSNVKVTVHGTGQTTYVQTVSGKNFVARSAYNIAVDNFPSGTNASGEDVSWEYTPATTEIENGHEWVDLGLPSGLKWATMNVGATKPEEYGDYFAWGEVEPKAEYNWNTYQWCNGSFNNQTKYCTSSNYGTVDNKTVLDLEDDVAHVKWGGNWRMPTKAERDELCNKCSGRWTSQGGVNGYAVTGPNGNSIFLPAAGYRGGSNTLGTGYSGYYWCSSLRENPSIGSVWTLYFYSRGVESCSYERYDGFCVRPVCP